MDNLAACAYYWQTVPRSSGGNAWRKKKKETSSKGGNFKIQPLGDRVVVERDESETVTAGGIALPDSATDKPARGKIINVGDGSGVESRHAAGCRK